MSNYLTDLLAKLSDGGQPHPGDLIRAAVVELSNADEAQRQSLVTATYHQQQAAGLLDVARTVMHGTELDRATPVTQVPGLTLSVGFVRGNRLPAPCPTREVDVITAAVDDGHGPVCTTCLWSPSAHVVPADLVDAEVLCERGDACIMPQDGHTHDAQDGYPECIVTACVLDADHDGRCRDQYGASVPKPGTRGLPIDRADRALLWDERAHNR